MDRVTRAEAARQLGLNKSTVTRWCKSNPALVDDDGRVSVPELKSHRDAVINPRLQTRGPAVEHRGTPSTPAAVEAPNDSRNRLETAKAHIQELDLADRLGQTVRRDEVEAAVAEAGEMFHQRCGQVARDQAEALARIDDVREMESAVAALIRNVISATIADLAQAISRDEGRDAA